MFYSILFIFYVENLNMHAENNSIVHTRIIPPSHVVPFIVQGLLNITKQEVLNCTFPLSLDFVYLLLFD